MRVRIITWEYRCYSQNYQYSTYVRAGTLREARCLGLREAKMVMGTHARIQRDEVKQVE